MARLFIQGIIMRRIFVESIRNDRIEIAGEAHKHLSVVLRAKKGQKIELCCGDGYVYTAIITEFFKDKTIIEIIDKQPDDTEPKISCDLFLCIIKGEHLEFAIQKAVELGVNKIYPILSENSVKTDINETRLNKIAMQAAMQCGRGRVPFVESPKKITDVYKDLCCYDALVFPYEKEKKYGIAELLKTKAANKSQNIAVIIGPEGGFTAQEAEALSAISLPVTLGRRILRADTAAVVSITAVMLAFGEIGGLR